MKKIIISSYTHGLIRNQAMSTYVETATKLPDGNYSVAISEDVFDKLNNNRLENETIDDTIQRIMFLALNKRQ